jgi:hypothetical protein
MSRASGIAAVFVLGVVVMLAASPAAAKCLTECTCATSCDYLCVDGTCPDCEVITCEEWGRCVGSPGCTDPCTCTSTINGTSGGDTLNGGSADECINGLGGDDTITGGAGYDCADGGTGADDCYAEYEINCDP